ncbi:amino acid adenylation domain-containing protein [Microcoleus sp. FACHB-672]|uniref:amino acid adenylation domain-containing protein n=1 Tax=Microcoleus sp. FACHB-672 TaxID=2692825 RepID=UPI00168357ED|nr:non-ribosomal peptide synthetase [Microcoleus sp. FACHB-672]MBD2039313.1 amino acid adenylation domain-containing protein [Microcoleus sp. FACHB-672]
MHSIDFTNYESGSNSLENFPVINSYQLSPQQQSRLFASLTTVQSGTDIEQVIVVLRESLNVSAFQQAWARVVDRHPILRTSFHHLGSNEACQEVRQQVALTLQQQDWCDLPANEIESRLAAFLEADRQIGFELSAAPLMRVAILQVAAAEYRAIWSFHPVLLDNWSVEIALKEVFAFYEAFSAGYDLSLKQPRAYGDYIEWLQQQDFSQTEVFWRQQLQGLTAPTAVLPAIPPAADKAQPEIGFVTQEIRLSPVDTLRLQAWAQQHQLTLETLLQGAWALLLSRYSGQSDVVFGATVTGRPSVPGLESVVGLFSNIVPVRVHVSPAQSPVSWLTELRQTYKALQAYQHTPLTQIQQWSEFPSETPLFESILVFENYLLDSFLLDSALELHGSSWENRELQHRHQRNYPLTLTGYAQPEFLLKLEYDTQRIDAGTINRMLGHLKTLLESLAANPEGQLKDLPMLTEQELQQMLVEWNNTAAEYPKDACIHQLFEAQVERTPDAVAVIFGDIKITYRQLNTRANKLAYHLQTLGVKPEVRVGICADRSLEVVEALLAIFKAGGVYVPLDPTYPKDRLAFMLEDSAVPVLLTQTHLVEQLPEHNGQVVCLDAVGEEVSQQSDENLISPTTQAHAAYVIYTSGTTGKPKAVVAEHGNLINYILATQDRFQFDTTDVMPCIARFSFSISLFELLAPLMAGGSVVVLSRENVLDMNKLVGGFGQLTNVHLTPSLMRKAIDFIRAQGLEAKDFKNIRRVFMGGDTVAPDLLEDVKPFFQDAQIYVMYGCSEATTLCLNYKLPTDIKAEKNIVGRPFNNVRIRIYDEQQNLVPAGVSGEIYVGGAGVTRGYANREDLTQEKYVWIDNQRWYKTGDVGRYQSDGNIELLGRTDFQVSLRGFRIETGEVESVLRQHPAIKDAVVAAKDDESGETRLVGYLVLQQEPAPASRALRHFLGEKLPEYMVPSVFVTLAALPVTPNGKQDRKALPAPEWTRLPRETEYVAPRSLLEEELAGIWGETIGVEQVGIHDNFFDLGGHSLHATQVLSRVRESFEVNLSMRSLFECPTVAELGEQINVWLRGGQIQKTAPIVPVSRDTNLPLSFSQQRLWFLEQLEAGNSAYNIPAAVQLKGTLNTGILKRSINEIVRRHESLRTTFGKQEDGQPFQVIAPALTVELPVVDLSAIPEPQRSEEAQRLALAEADTSYDFFTNEPLIRAQLVRLAEDEHLFLLTIHHIISDGWSFGLLMRELATIYEAFNAGNPSPLPELSVQYADFAHWQRHWLQDEVLETQLSYWKQQLGGKLPVLELPTDRPRPPLQTFNGAKESLVLSQELSEEIKALSRREGATLFMTLLAAFNTLLCRHSGQEDIIVGSPIAGRNRAEIEHLIGFFVNTLVLRNDLSGNPSFRELLERVREVALGAYAHQELPFEKLVEAVQPERDRSRNPIFQVWFNLLNYEDNQIEIPGLTLDHLSFTEQASKFDITLYAQEQNEGTKLELVYNTDLFDRQRMVEMLAQLQHLLEQIVKNPSEQITHFSLVTSQTQELLPNPNQAIEDCWEGAVHTHFSQQAQRVGNSTAIIDRQGNLTYSELDKISNQVADYLHKNGIGSQDVVAIYAHRSAPIVVALLGILKAGAAFTILDANYPAERLIDCLQLTQPKGWLQMSAGGKLPESLETFVGALSTQCRLRLPSAAGEIGELLKDYSTENPHTEINPDDLAYIAFTSGSTGKPKGILGTHKPLSHFLQWHAQTFNLNESDRFSVLSGLAHDPLLRDIFTPLWLGATLCIPAPEEIGTPGKLSQWMKQQQITISHLTPAMGVLLTETSQTQQLTNLRYAFFGGDVLTTRDVEKLQLLAPNITCVNFYGATETPQAMGYYTVPTQQGENSPTYQGRIPLGRGIKDVQLLVLNSAHRLAGIGEIGEIYIRTSYLAKGYLGDESMTAERFLTNPFTQSSEDRLYKTGDLGRYLPDGNISVVGRADNQVKIRGFRIEPGEIEAVLWQHPNVRQSVVIAREDVPGEKRLVAYVVPKEQQAELKSSELRGFVKAKLPDYMVPSAFVILESIPLTPNGKIDRKGLPAPDTSRSESEGSFVAPRDDLELQLTKIWETVIGVTPIGVKDNFFELGGHSLLAVRLFTEIEKICGKNLPLATLFQAPTIEQLASLIRQERWAAPTESLVLLSPGGDKPPLFCIYGILLYHDLAKHLGGDRPVYGIYLQAEVDLLKEDNVNKEESPLNSVPGVASLYLKEIRKRQPVGPYYLAGESFGGLVAFEMAHQLRAEGETVELVALFDTFAPDGMKGLPLGRRMAIHLETFMQKGHTYIFDRIQAKIASTKDKVLSLVGKMSSKFDQGSERSLSKSLQKITSNDARRTVRHQAVRNYVPQPYPGKVTLFRAMQRSEFESYYTDPKIWTPFTVGGLEVHDVPGNHIGILKQPNVQVLASKLKACLEQASAED